MKINKKELPKNQLELSIEITPSEYQKFLEKTAQEMSQNIKISGFRPGKAPYEVLKKKLGEMHIFEHALDSILTHFYFEAIVQEKLEPISHPQVNIEKMAIGNPLVFKAIVNLIPDIKLCDLEKIKVKKLKAKVTKEEIDKAIETLRENQAPEVLEDKKIENGDKINIDFTVSLDGVPIEGGRESNYPLIVGKGHMIPGFEENLLHKKAKDQVEFKLKFPDKYHNKQVAGKEADFKVTIKAVYRRKLPLADDSWAKTLLGAKDLNDLKEKIRKNYELEKQRDVDRKMEIEIMDKIIDASEIGDFSDDLIKTEAHKMIAELKQSVEQQGLKFSDYINQLGKKVEDMEKDFRPQAERRLKSSLVIRAIVDQEKIEVKDQELNAEIETAKKMYAHNQEMLKSLDSSHYREHLRLGILNKKVMDFLKTHCIQDKKS